MVKPSKRQNKRPSKRQSKNKTKKTRKYKSKGGSLLASLQSNILPLSILTLNNRLTKKNIKKFTKKLKIKF